MLFSIIYRKDAVRDRSLNKNSPHSEVRFLAFNSILWKFSGNFASFLVEPSASYCTVAPKVEHSQQGSASFALVSHVVHSTWSSRDQGALGEALENGLLLQELNFRPKNRFAFCSCRTLLHPNVLQLTLCLEGKIMHLFFRVAEV